MTSRELFKKWKEFIIIECSCDRNDINELEQIEKDLEVLNIFIELFDTEIIKLKKWCILDDVYQFKLQFKEEEFNITERQYKVIKEWLRRMG